MSAASAVGLPALITRAADRFALTDQATPVSSALGLWLLLALVAPAAKSEEREQLQDALSCPVRAAVDYADQLTRALQRRRPALGDRHPVQRWRAGFVDLGFTTATQGVVIHGKPETGTTQPGQVDCYY